jgi:hypothetical protein
LVGLCFLLSADEDDLIVARRALIAQKTGNIPQIRKRAASADR